MFDGFVALSAVEQGKTEVVMGFGKAGLDFQRLLKMGDGFVAPPRPARTRPRL